MATYVDGHVIIVIIQTSRFIVNFSNYLWVEGAKEGYLRKMSDKDSKNSKNFGCFNGE